MNAQEWVKSAVILLPFRSDRKAIGEELTAHIEDRKAALTAAGVPEDQAEEQAVAAMGDPNETAKALRQAMASWMNTVIVLLQITALVLAVVVAVHLYNFIRERQTLAPPADSQLEEILAPYEYPRVLRDGHCAETASSAGHTVSVPWAKMTRDGRVMVLLEIDGSFWETGPTEFRKMLKFRDPDGTEPTVSWGNAGRQGGTSYISVVTTFFLDPDTPWVELSFEYGKEPFCLRIEFDEAKP